MRNPFATTSESPSTRSGTVAIIAGWNNDRKRAERRRHRDDVEPRRTAREHEGRHGEASNEVRDDHHRTPWVPVDDRARDREPDHRRRQTLHTEEHRRRAHQLMGAQRGGEPDLDGQQVGPVAEVRDDLRDPESEEPSVAEQRTRTRAAAGAHAPVAVQDQIWRSHVVVVGSCDAGVMGRLIGGCALGQGWRRWRDVLGRRTKRGGDGPDVRRTCPATSPDQTGAGRAQLERERSEPAGCVVPGPALASRIPGTASVRVGHDGLPGPGRRELDETRDRHRRCAVDPDRDDGRVVRD